MSVRAYRLIKIKTEKEPTFNCWHDNKIFDLADTENYINDSVVITFDKETVERALKKHKKGTDNYKILSQILKEMGNDDTVEYYCY